MQLRWLIYTNNDPEDSSGDTKKLQVFISCKEGQSEQQALDDDSNWEDVPEIIYNYRKGS